MDTPAEPRVKVAPEYPSLAREAHVDGTVIVMALVCEHGNVREVRSIKSIPMLDGAAVEAVKRWRFRPAQLNGVAVPSWVETPVKFSIGEDPAR